MTDPATALRRFWPAFTLGLLAFAAYFQAKGVSQLMATMLVERPRSAAAAVGPPRADTPGHAPDATAILARNPFDSITGSLLPSPDEASAHASTPQITDPLAVPKCEGFDVEITTESPDPRFSLALIEAPGEKRGQLRRIGDDVGDKRVVYIGFNPREQSPAVWMSGNGTLCQSLLFDRVPEPKKPAPVAKKAPAPKRNAKRQAAPLPKNIADRIQKLSETELNVDRAVVDVVMDKYRDLMKGTVVKPVVKNGQVAGMQIYRVQPTSLLGHLGLKNGDVLKSINGFALTGPEKALQAYARLRTASDIRIQVERGGKSQTVELHIR